MLHQPQRGKGGVGGERLAQAAQRALAPVAVLIARPQQHLAHRRRGLHVRGVVRRAASHRHMRRAEAVGIVEVNNALASSVLHDIRALHVHHRQSRRRSQSPQSCFSPIKQAVSLAIQRHHQVHLRTRPAIAPTPRRAVAHVAQHLGIAGMLGPTHKGRESTLESLQVNRVNAQPGQRLEGEAHRQLEVGNHRVALGVASPIAPVADHRQRPGTQQQHAQKCPRARHAIDAQAHMPHMRRRDPAQHVGLNIGQSDRIEPGRHRLGLHAARANDVDDRQVSVGRVLPHRHAERAVSPDLAAAYEVDEQVGPVFDRGRWRAVHVAQDAVELVANHVHKIKHVGIELAIELGDDLQRGPVWRGQEARVVHVVQAGQAVVDLVLVELEVLQQRTHQIGALELEPQTQARADLALGQIRATEGHCWRAGRVGLCGRGGGHGGLLLRVRGGVLKAAAVDCEIECARSVHYSPYVSEGLRTFEFG